MVVANTMVSDDVTHRAAVDCKQLRPEHRPLRNADVELHDWSLMLTQLDELSPALEVQPEPGQWCSSDAELGLQPLKQYAVVDCVKRR